MRGFTAMRATRRRAIAVIAVSLAIWVIEWIAMLLAHSYTQVVPWQDDIPFPTLFLNPFFLLLVLASILLSIGFFAHLDGVALFGGVLAPSRAANPSIEGR